MRIIDKNTDFYDYIAGVYQDNAFTFDRTDSYLLTKDIFADHLYMNRHGLYYQYKNKRLDKNASYHNLVLMQVCHRFWLFSAELTEIDHFDKVKKYKLELISTWEDRLCRRVLIRLNTITFHPKIFPQHRYVSASDYSFGLQKHLPAIINAINSGDYKISGDMCYHRYYHMNQWFEKRIPILKACGIAELVDPLEIYLAFEEYFSLEKTSSERTESLNLTDKEKIENHGFDLKTSFRN